MSKILHRLGHRTRWQIFARVLPVMFLAVLSLGAISWLVFTHHATRTAEKIEKSEVVNLLDNFSRRASLEAMAVEVRQNDFLARGGRSDGIHLVEDLLEMELVDGVALGRPGAAEVQAPGIFSLVSPLATASNRARIAAWMTQYSHCFRPGFRPGGWSKIRFSDAPVLVKNNPGHPVYLFPPLLLESPGDDARSKLAVLPVLVRDEQEGATTGHPVYFLDLEALVGDFQPPGMWLVLNSEGVIMVSPNESTQVGTRLADRPSDDSDGVFGVASGSDIWQPMNPGEDLRATTVGRRFMPWIVTAARGRDLPFTLLTIHEVAGLRAMGPPYGVTVFCVALIALVLALVLVSRVIDRIYQHLSHLASSKDEAHRLVQIKADHLRGTLDDMRVLDKAKDDFLILISHEVRTPLTSIMGGVNILKSSVAQLKGADREILDRLNILEIASIIESSGQRLTGFMNDAIQMTSIQSRDRKLVLQAVPVVDLVEIGLCGIRERAHLRGITVTNELAEGTDWSVLCDPKVLKVAFEKILNNAVVHNFEGGRIVVREAKNVPGQAPVANMAAPDGECFLKGQASYRKWKHEPVTWRLIEIFNTGDPIPEDRRKALFGKFELVGRIEHHQKGSGLSIPIASSAVKNHGGQLVVHADKRMGNSFFMMLPTLSSEARSLPDSGQDSGDQEAHGVGGGSGDKKVGEVADAPRLEVEFDDTRPRVASGPDQTGGGIDRTGSSDHHEEVTIGGDLR